MPSQTYFNLPTEKQERIMNAIIYEMGLHDYDAFNIASVIRESKIPRGSFYQYFKGKNDVFEYFYAFAAQKKISYFGDLYIGEHDIPFLDRFLQLYLSGFKFGFENPDLLKAAKKIYNSDHFIKSKIMKDSIDKSINAFTSFIKKDQVKGRIKSSIDPELLASFLLEFSTKVTLEEYFENEDSFDKIERKIRQLVEMLKKGIE